MRHIWLFFTWKCKHRPYSIRKFQTLFSILVRLSSVCNNVIVYAHYIPLQYMFMCLSVYQSIFHCTVSCQSVTLVSHTTCLSFVNVYVGTCPPICHVRVHHYMSVSRSVTPCPAHVFLSSFFVSVCQYTCLSVTFICTISSICVCVSVFLRPYVPYIMFTAMCPCICLPHSCILYVPFVHFYDCLSIYVSLCMSVLFLSASLYVSKRDAYWDRLCRDVVGCHARALWPNGAS